MGNHDDSGSHDTGSHDAGHHGSGEGEATVASNTAALNQLDRLLNTEPMTCPANPALGPNQWLRIYVPTKHTTLTLGYQDTGGTNQGSGHGGHEESHGADHSGGGHARHAYTGFTLTTDGHGFASVGGRMGIESRGHMIVQSTEGSAYFGAPGSALFTSCSGMHVASPGGVVIHGGGFFGVDVPKQDSRNAQAPDLPDAAGGADTLHSELSSRWGNFDGGIASLCVLKGLTAAGRSIFNRNAGKWTAVIAGAGAVRDAGWATVSFCSAAGVSGFEGTAIHGEKGVVCMSMGFTSVFALMGFMIGSAVSIFLGGKYTELYGGLTSSLESKRHVSIDSDHHCEILATEALEFSSRDGTVNVDAEQITTGGGAHGTAQKATKTLVFTGNDLLFQSKDAFHVGGKESVNLGADNVVFTGKDHGIFAAKKEIFAHVGTNHIHLNLGGTVLSIGDDSGSVTPTPAVSDGWSRPKYHQFDPSEQTRYADKLAAHIKRVKKVSKGWTQVNFKKKNIKFYVEKSCAADCKGNTWKFAKAVEAKK